MTQSQTRYLFCARYVYLAHFWAVRIQRAKEAGEEPG